MNRIFRKIDYFYVESVSWLEYWDADGKLKTWKQGYFHSSFIFTLFAAIVKGQI